MVVKMVVRRSWRHNRSIPSQQRCMAAAAAVRPWLWAVAPGSGAARDQEWRPTALCTRDARGVNNLRNFWSLRMWAYHTVQ